MIIFLFGQDTYSSRKKLGEMIEQYKKTHKNGLSFQCLDGRTADFQEFRDSSRQSSMFNEKKLIVLMDILSNIKFGEEFLQKIEDFRASEDVFIFYEGGDIPAKNKLALLLKKHGKCQEFKPPTEARLKDWIKKQAESYGARIDSFAVAKLAEFAGNDLWRLSNEIGKVISFKGSNAAIASRDIELLIRPKIESDIFRTVDAVASRNKNMALSLIRKHLEMGDSPAYLLSMINFQFRNLLTIKDFIEKRRPYGVILKESRLHPYVVRKSYGQAQKFTFRELKKIYRKIFQADFDIKTGRLDPLAALDLLIAEM